MVVGCLSPQIVGHVLLVLVGVWRIGGNFLGGNYVRVHTNLELLLRIKLDAAFASVKPQACAPVDPLGWSLVPHEVGVGIWAQLVVVPLGLERELSELISSWLLGVLHCLEARHVISEFPLVSLSLQYLDFLIPVHHSRLKPIYLALKALNLGIVFMVWMKFLGLHSLWEN